MDKIYFKPETALFDRLSFFNLISAQYTFDFSECPSGDPSHFNQILTVLDHRTFTQEACLPNSMSFPENTLLSTFNCVQTGGVLYTNIVLSSEPGHQLTCDSVSSDLVLTIRVDHSLPSVCTLTNLISVPFDNTQIC